MANRRSRFSPCVKKHLCLFGWVAILLACNEGAATTRPQPAVHRPAQAKATRAMTVVFLGDSVARGTGDETGRGFSGILEQELEKRGFDARASLNLAIDGARTRHVLDQLERPRVRELVGRADIVVLSIGGNDLFIDSQGRRADIADAQRMADNVVERVGRVIDRIRESNRHAIIFLLALYNPFFDDSFGSVAAAYVKQWNDGLVQRFDGSHGVVVVETLDLLNEPDRLAFDRFHPSAKGYELISERIAGEIK
jgi:lysophospholipase L1-like esterase